MMSKEIKNVWYLATLSLTTFLALLVAAVYVGILEGSFGCGGGTVGAMIPVGSLLIGLLIGVCGQFAPNPNKEE